MALFALVSYIASRKVHNFAIENFARARSTPDVQPFKLMKHLVQHWHVLFAAEMNVNYISLAPPMLPALYGWRMEEFSSSSSYAALGT